MRKSICFPASLIALSLILTSCSSESDLLVNEWMISDVEIVHIVDAQDYSSYLNSWFPITYSDKNGLNSMVHYQVFSHDELPKIGQICSFNIKHEIMDEKIKLSNVEDEKYTIDKLVDFSCRDK